MDNKLDRLDAKLDKLDERMDSLDRTMERNTATLEEHHRRTTALESQVLETENRFLEILQPVLEQHNRIKYIGLTLYWLALGFTGVLGVIYTLKELGAF